MSDVIQTLIDSLKTQCNFHKNGDCFTRACLTRGYKAGGPKYSIASCLPREQAAAIEQQRAALAVAKEALEECRMAIIMFGTVAQQECLLNALSRIAELKD